LQLENRVSALQELETEFHQFLSAGHLIEQQRTGVEKES